MKTQAHIRTCRLCGEKKPLEEYTRNRTKSMGYDYLCKACHRKQEQERRRADPEKSREVNRRSVQNNKGHWGAMWADYQKRYCAKYPERHRANGRLNYRIGKGDIIRPLACSRCGATSALEAHHPDYSKPLEVEWLCLICHKEEHGRLANV